MSARRRGGWLALALASVLVLAGCSGTDDGGSGDRPDSSATPTEPPEPDPAPEAGQCHRMSWEAALSPLPGDTRVGCRKRHTSQTFHVGRLKPAELSEVDSPAVQARVAKVCGDRLRTHAGAEPGALRLTMVETVWFTPSLEQADLGADWFRCDLVVVDGPERLRALPPRTKGIASEEDVRMCSTAEPGSKEFQRVPCGRKHAWRAVASVDLAGDSYPSAETAEAVLEDACRDVALDNADDPLAFRWAEERPTKAQWKAGRHYGLCWVPAGS